MWAAQDDILATYNAVGLNFTSPLYFYALEFILLSWAWWLLPALIGFVLNFPVQLGPMRRNRRAAVQVLYGTPILLTVGCLAANALDVYTLTLAGMAGTFFISVVFSLGYSVRRKADPAVRAQTSWLILGLVISVILPLCWFFLSVFLPESEQVHWLEYVVPFAPIALPFCAAVAILRHGLFDIDVIINRSLVYGLMTALVVGSYVLVVGFLGSALRGQNNLFVSLVATGLIAVVFQPVRERIQRGVNRMMYGQRDEPVAVLSQLGARLEQIRLPGEALPGLVETVARGLKLPYAAIVLRLGDEDRLQAETGRATPSTEAFPLIYQGQAIGQLRVARRTDGAEFNAADRLLLTNIARQAGAVARAVQLNTELQQSRQELVNAREEERRRLRRDLHDGLGPQLASQSLTLEAIGKLLERDHQKAYELIEHLRGQSRAAIQDVRRLVHGLRPPALDELGLVGAIRQQLAQEGEPSISVEITSEPSSLPALPAAMEVAAYRIALEGVTNVIRHSDAGHAQICLHAQQQGLEISISDDGHGYPAGVHEGVGLNSMRERAEELGGMARFENQPGGGAHVQVWLPLPES